MPPGTQRGIFLFPFTAQQKTVQPPIDKALLAGHHIYSKCTYSLLLSELEPG
jgi:hypothetical protein